MNEWENVGGWGKLYKEQMEILFSIGNQWESFLLSSSRSVCYEKFCIDGMHHKDDFDKKNSSVEVEGCLEKVK
jgi:hypothetical protein